MRMSLAPRLVVSLLVAALIASPSVLDACMFTCHGSTDTATQGSEPSCHHGGDDMDVRVSAPAASCGHDHSPSPTTMTSRARGLDARSDVGPAGVWNSFEHGRDPIRDSLPPDPMPLVSRAATGAPIPLRV